MTFRATIILACHNVDHYIEDAFDSILRQSIFDELEVIPVDDGSTDRTREIIKDYAARHPQNFFPILFDDASGGPGRPRNAGLDVATSNLILFMDPDDRILDDGYTTLVRTMERHDSDIVIATRYGVPPKQGAAECLWVDYLTPTEIINGNGYALKVDLLERRPVILKSIYRRDFMERHDLRFLEQLSTSEDEIFDMKYLLLADRITKIHDVVYLYTAERPDSITSKVRLKVYEDLEDIFFGLDDALRTYFDDKIIAYRLASLLRTFYLPKLLRLDPEDTDAALDLIHRACEKYGFETLKLTEQREDLQIVELIEQGQFVQLALFFMNERNSKGSSLIRSKNRRLEKSLNRKSIRIASGLTKAIGRGLDIARRSDRAKLIAASRPEGGFDQESNGYWVFMDRRDKAGDNAEALYRYARDHSAHDRIAFVIQEDCPDHARLRADGFHLVPYNSIEHWRLLYGARYLITSHVDDVILYPWQSFGEGIKAPLYKLVFLQHGIIRSDLSGWLGQKNYHLFCSSARPEYDSLLGNLAYHLTPDTVRLTGLARHDLLEDTPADHILVCPTWRSFLADVPVTEFEESEFYLRWQELFRSPAFNKTLEQAGVRAKILLHSSLAPFAARLDLGPRCDLVDFHQVPSFAELVSGARMLVTDYSTISFDTLYLRRPVIYFTFPESAQHDMNRGARLDYYEAMGTRVTTTDAVSETTAHHASTGWQLEPEKRAMIDRFFAYDDRNNRRRIIEALQADGG